MKTLSLIPFLLMVILPVSAQQRAFISTDRAPKAIGPYSQAVDVHGMVFVSGQLGMDPVSGALMDGIREQTSQSLTNLEAVLAEAGSSLKDVVSCTVYMKDLNDFAVMNEVYATYFPKDAPSRATVQVARLPKDGLVEISCIAVKP